jgi:hypothetical protein
MSRRDTALLCDIDFKGQEVGMNRHGNHVSGWLIAMCAVASSGLASCGVPDFDVEVHLITTSCNAAKADPLKSVTQLRFTVFGDGINALDSQTSVAVSAGTTPIPHLKIGAGRNIVVEGLASADASSVVLSRGESGPLDFTVGKSLATTIFLRPVDTFSPALTPNSASDPQSASACLASKPRAAHTATVLENGKLLLVGGFAPSGTTNTYLNSAEIYDWSNGTLTPAASLALRRAYHTATHFPGTRFTLIVGGENESGATDTTELYDEDANTFTTIPMAKVNGGQDATRTRHVAVLPLPASDGTQFPLIILGGYSGQNAATASSPLKTVITFDIGTQTFKSTSIALKSGIAEATGIALEDGRVLIAGGWNGSSAIADVFTLRPLLTGSFSNPESTVLTMSQPRIWPMVTLLPSAELQKQTKGIVSITGGFTNRDTGTKHNLLAPTSTTDMINFNAGTLLKQAGATLTETRGLGAAVALLNGQVLVTGGEEVPGSGMVSTSQTANVFFFNSVALTLTGRATKQPLIAGRFQHQTTLLPDGTAAVTGGIQFANGNASALGTIEIFQPSYVIKTDSNGNVTPHN